MPHNRVSAWAGLHYFVSRRGLGANTDSQSVVTWPEGNGFLVDRLRERVSDQVSENSLAYRVENTEDGVQVDVLNTTDKSRIRYSAQHAIYCGPRFTAERVIEKYVLEPAMKTKLEYMPWLIANITLSKPPISHGAPLSWDNVSYYSPSLGYIVANHQDLKQNRSEAVITYYLPLDSDSADSERKKWRDKSYSELSRVVAQDLEKMHPGITPTIRQLDVWLWGHGMISPGIGHLWSEGRKSLARAWGHIEFAHSDMSGISIFEEAQYQGVEAAKRVLKRRAT
ncbi:MAG: hypothetical protein EOP09_04935 [Proteobacteria bacterium]|nr:MAG: hypothetical protein EOP09_04935 [Pseudomonadota bacterium]